MVPDISRRRYVAALSAVGAASLAGCTGSPAGDDDSTSTPTATPTTTATTTEPTTTDDASDTATNDPTAPVEAFIAAEDVETFQSQFHPLHPFHPENLDAEDAESLLGNGVDAESLDAERVDQPVTPDLVQAATLPGTEVDSDAIVDALDGTDAAVVAASMTNPEGETEETRFVTVSVDGEWVILAQGVPTQADLEARQLDARVVDDVTFDTEADTARVNVLDDPVADSLTVEATNSESARSSETPEAETSLDVDVAPDGDEVVVTATVDGESRVVHRERYPKSSRILDEIEFDDDPEDDDRDAIARVRFDTEKERRVLVESTVKHSSAEAEPVGVTHYLNIGIDPDGDEVVVTYPVGDDAEEVHRERYHP